jgi:hypothetical protein
MKTTTEARSPIAAAGETRRRGNLLIMTLLLMAFAASAVMTIMTLVTDQTRDVRITNLDLVARQAAQAGVNQGIATVRTARDMGLTGAPFGVIDHIDADAAEGVGHYTRLHRLAQRVDHLRGQPDHHEPR